ncbi:MAG TPA: efflux RND transporter permease subunit, partial [Chitinophagaceae bacterium]|nr:efflux RND transporter permease subunit [Chitinophagaceae bacterium]
LSSATLLYLAGQTINIMTLGGLALSVGILVDEATVTIENIHRHMETGKSKARAIADASREIASSKLLILLSVLAVFVPSFFMHGVPKAMFVPLSLAVGFAMIPSFLLSQSFVPVLANWWLHHRLTGKERQANSFFNRLRKGYVQQGSRLKIRPSLITFFFVLLSITLAALLFYNSGTTLFPHADTGQEQVRLRMPVGTRLERTEDATRKLLALINSIAGKENVLITSAFVGTQPSSFPVNYIHLWTSGPQESVTKINLKPGAINQDSFRTQLREAVKKAIPEASISFEQGDIAGQVLNLGFNNPVEIAVVNRDLDAGGRIATQLAAQLRQLPFLKDVQIATPLGYPAIRLDVDRVKAGQLNITEDQITKSTVTATSSSRFTSPSYWLDKTTGTAYIVQVQYPEYRMNSTEQLEMVPVAAGNGVLHQLGEVASWKKISMPGEYDRLNQQRYVTITANIEGVDAGHAYKKINSIVNNTILPRGSKILLRGQPQLLHDTFTSLQLGVLVAAVVIFLLMAVFFRSFRIAFVTLSIVPAVVAGSLLLLLLTGQTINIQSYMGGIMAVGVAIANAVLYITAAETERTAGGKRDAFIKAAENRFRPIVMTTIAMIAGMIPIAAGLGEGGSQTAPLGIAVIGGLLFSVASVLFFLPQVYQYMAGSREYISASLDPDDINSRNYSFDKA